MRQENDPLKVSKGVRIAIQREIKKEILDLESQTFKPSLWSNVKI